MGVNTEASCLDVSEEIRRPWAKWSDESTMVDYYHKSKHFAGVEGSSEMISMFTDSSKTRKELKTAAFALRRSMELEEVPELVMAETPSSLSLFDRLPSQDKCERFSELELAKGSSFGEHGFAKACPVRTCHKPEVTLSEREMKYFRSIVNYD